MTDANPALMNTRPPEVIKARGAWPFVTHVLLRHPDGREEARHSRAHRKGLPVLPFWKKGLALLVRAAWMPRELNWWIGIVFAVGASLFALGSVLFLVPAMAAAWSISETQANGIFFLGSIPFTIAAYLQLFQAANAGPMENAAATGSAVRVWFGWRPGDAGWLSCTLQFLGTLLFNLNTFDAMHPAVDWWQQDLEIWVPNRVGSIFFLAAGYLAWIEVCHAHWAWEPGHISWWVGGINLIGCIAFLASSRFAFVPPHALPFDTATPSLVFTLIGAIAFFIGALLLLPETAAAKFDRTP
jgi:hypothetical protein